MRTTETQELSRREREIALAYADGASHREIAARFFIAPSTVRTHLGTIYRKLGVSSKIALLHALNVPGRSLPAPDLNAIGLPRRASVAIMPFRGVRRSRDHTADGLVQDIISGLSRLRSVRVIARGSIFALADRGVGEEDAGRLLDVDYVTSGTMRRIGERIEIVVELVERQTRQIIWSDDYQCRTEDVFAALDKIGDRIVAALASEIEASERNRALLKHPDSLGAWESFHRGLWHMYRFTDAENQTAQALFRRAVGADPTFARAYAGLSFTHFQNAFLLHPGDRSREMAQAYETAGQALAADERDPAAHWAMGRAMWLRGDDAQAVAELSSSVGLSPNFSGGHYALAFVNSQSGDAGAAVASADQARTLSPFDPLLFGMLASRAMALFRLGAFDEAAEWAIRAAERPNAHVHILTIAALCLAGAGRLDEGGSYLARIRRIQPGYHASDFFSAFRFPPDALAEFRSSAMRLGMI